MNKLDLYEEEEQMLTGILLRFIDKNLEDHGYVSIDDYGLVLEGSVKTSEEERALLQRIFEEMRA